MNTTPHTPGPWTLGHTSMNPHLATVVAPSGLIVAEPHVRDARLIAAAPRLLQRLVETNALLVAQFAHAANPSDLRGWRDQEAYAAWSRNCAAIADAAPGA